MLVKEASATKGPNVQYHLLVNIAWKIIALGNALGNEFAARGVWRKYEKRDWNVWGYVVRGSKNPYRW